MSRSIFARLALAGLVVGLLASATGFAAETSSPRERTTLVLVVGAPGEATYQAIFDEELKLWRTVVQTSDVELHVIGDSTANEATAERNSDKDELRQLLSAEANRGASPCWLVFIGHGTFDGRTAAFNLRGPDLSSGELAEWLQAWRRPLAVVNTTAASAPFLTALSAPERVVITATKSGQERNYARFGRYFARRVIDPAADLDKDEQTSLFEAFLAAGRDTAEFYKSEGRIATEHPLLDDNGDGKGIRVEMFAGDQAIEAQGAVDGAAARRLHLHPSRAERQLSAAQIERRDELEAKLSALREQKSELDEEAYFARLEPLLVELSRLYAE